MSGASPSQRRDDMGRIADELAADRKTLENLRQKLVEKRAK
jgi:hypothetical protein